MQIQPTTREDIETLAAQLGDRQRRDLLATRELDPAIHEEQMSTCFAAGEPIAIAGVLQFTDPGFLVAFAFLGKRALEHRLTLTRWGKACVRTTIERFDPRRIEITTRSDLRSHGEWAEVLGFEFEGVMAAWGEDGSDHDRYALVRQPRT